MHARMMMWAAKTATSSVASCSAVSLRALDSAVSATLISSSRSRMLSSWGKARAMPEGLSSMSHMSSPLQMRIEVEYPRAYPFGLTPGRRFSGFKQFFSVSTHTEFRNRTSCSGRRYRRKRRVAPAYRNSE
jgi:hypothetical protein